MNQLRPLEPSSSVTLTYPPAAKKLTLISAKRDISNNATGDNQAGEKTIKGKQLSHHNSIIHLPKQTIEPINNTVHDYQDLSLSALHPLKRIQEGAPIPVTKSIPNIAPADLCDQLTKIYIDTLIPKEHATKIQKARSLSISVKDVFFSTGSDLSEDNVRKMEFEKIFKTLEAAHTAGIRKIEFQGKEEMVSIKLETIVQTILKDPACQSVMKKDPEMNAFITRVSIACILEECRKAAKDLNDLLQSSRSKIQELINILGLEYEVQVDDGVCSINLNDKFIDTNNPTLFLKKIGICRVNYEMLMLALKGDAKKVKIALAKDVEHEFVINHPSTLYQTTLGIYQILASLLRIPFKYTQESFSSIIEDVYGRYCMAGKISHDRYKDMRSAFKLNWPAGDNQSLQIDYAGVLQSLEAAVALVKDDPLFFKRTETIFRCLKENSITRSRSYFYNDKNILRAEFATLFKSLSPSQKTELIRFTEEKTKDLIERLDRKDVIHKELLLRKRHTIKKLLNSV